MAKVNINPLPRKMRAIPRHLRPRTPPIAIGEIMTPADNLLAYKLWQALDLESRRWYMGWPTVRESTFCGIPLTAEDLEALES